MGRLERFESNMMTWVKPSNLKLIDRASRYAHKLLIEAGIEVEFNDVLKEIILNSTAKNLHITPIVMKVFHHFSSTKP